MKYLKLSVLLIVASCVTIQRSEVLANRPTKPSIRVERLDDKHAKISIEDLQKLNDYIIELEGYIEKLEFLVK